jgi:hypothetical protein
MSGPASTEVLQRADEAVAVKRRGEVSGGCVRFTDGARVVEYRLSATERDLKRRGSACLEPAPIEMRLYDMVLLWKLQREAQGIAEVNAQTPLRGFLGAQRAARARELGVHSLGVLFHRACRFALEQRPAEKQQHEEDFLLLSVQVTNLAAEFLGSFFSYDFDSVADRERFLSNTFHVAKQLMALYNTVTASLA